MMAAVSAVCQSITNYRGVMRYRESILIVGLFASYIFTFLEVPKIYTKSHPPFTIPTQSLGVRGVHHMIEDVRAQRVSRQPWG